MIIHIEGARYVASTYFFRNEDGKEYGVELVEHEAPPFSPVYQGYGDTFQEALEQAIEKTEAALKVQEEALEKYYQRKAT